MSSFNITTDTSTLSSSLGTDSQGLTARRHHHQQQQQGVGRGERWAPLLPRDESHGRDRCRRGCHRSSRDLTGTCPFYTPGTTAPEGGMLLDLTSPGGFIDSGPLGYSNAGPLFEKRKRSRSYSSRHPLQRGVWTEQGPEGGAMVLQRGQENLESLRRA